MGVVNGTLRHLYRSEISANDSAKRFSDELGIDVYMGEAKFIGIYI